MNQPAAIPESPKAESPRVEQPLLDALAELRAACAATGSTRERELSPTSVPDWLRVSPVFEFQTIVPPYRRVQRAFAALLESWKRTSPALPGYQGGRTTAGWVQDICVETAREFDPRCTLQAAAQTSCVIATLRHVGWDLLDNLWQSGVDWTHGLLGAQSYSDAGDLPAGIWDIATGREATSEDLAELLAWLLPDAARDPERTMRALQGEGEFRGEYIGRIPFLPLAAWASAAAAWPDGLVERVLAIETQLMDETNDGPDEWVDSSPSN